MTNRRQPISALKLSAAAFVVLALSEAYVEFAMVPTVGDRWTYGIGATFKEDGSPVRKGDSIKPIEAMRLSLSHIEKDEARLKQCVKNDLSQVEYDVLVDFSYQYGVPTTCNSSIVKRINAGNYAGACDAYLLYKYSGGYDCTTMINGKPNKVCWGVWTRNVDRRTQCISGLL